MTENKLPYNEKKAIEALKEITTATLTTVLLKKGLRNVWLRGAASIKEGQPRLVGRAFTLRFVLVREDLATPESWSSPISTRAAIEAMPEGVVEALETCRAAHRPVRDRRRDCACSTTTCLGGGLIFRWSDTVA